MVNWYQFTFNLLPIYFQFTSNLLSIYFQLILNWFQFTEPGGLLIRGNPGYQSWGTWAHGRYPLWAVQIDVFFFLRNLIENRSFGEGWFFEVFQWLAVIREIKKPRKKRKTNWTKKTYIDWTSTNTHKKCSFFSALKCNEQCCSLYMHIYIYRFH